MIQRPARTNAQRRRWAGHLWDSLRRRRPGWEARAFSLSDKVRVPYDSNAAMEALDARLARVGMQRIVPKPKKRRAHL